MPTSNLHKIITSQTGWLNTSRAITAEDLQGRIVLLDFWTYCCINCMHVIPDLEYLEQKFGSDLTVIGVHSAKFKNEKDSENIRSAILRLGLHHPVVNDFDFKIWNSFGIRAWPTFVLINPKGIIESVYSGEGNRAAAERDIAKLIKKYPDANKTPLPIALEKDKVPPSVLSFPGKLTAGIWGNGDKSLPIIFVSDSGHHRIVAMAPGGIMYAIGSGKEGLKDGSFEEAQFRRPQGVLYRQLLDQSGIPNGVLYVADTENHALRLVDLKNKTVATIAGTGVQGHVRDAQNAPALQTPLASPWDLEFYPDPAHIAIAMAGTHQLWRYDIAAKTVSVIAGDGRESIDDGKYPNNSLSQPSGLSAWRGEPQFNLEIMGMSNVRGGGWIEKTKNAPAPEKIAGDGHKLYFVDSETSSLRVLENGEVKTLIGSGLFDFGYKEGAKGEALMQHPLGVFADETGVYIADSYNHSIRRYDPATGLLSNFAGHGERGGNDGPAAKAAFNEPNDILKIGDKFYVADTNNNAIRTIDAKGNASTLALSEATPQASAELVKNLPNLVDFPAATLANDTPISLTIALQKDWHINADAPSYLALFGVDEDRPFVIKQWGIRELKQRSITLPALKENQTYQLQVTLYYCEDKEGAQCLIKSFDIAITAKAGGQKTLVLQLN